MARKTAIVTGRQRAASGPVSGPHSDTANFVTGAAYGANCVVTRPDDMTLANAHAQPVASCLAELDAGPEGLSLSEAARRLADLGPNHIPEQRKRVPVLRFLVQFHNVLIYVLLAAAMVTGALQHWVDTGVILAVVLANAVIGFIQEGKAEAAMAAIRGMLAPRAAVLRNGARVTVDRGRPGSR